MQTYARCMHLYAIRMRMVCNCMPYASFVFALVFLDYSEAEINLRMQVHTNACRRMLNASICMLNKKKKTNKLKKEEGKLASPSSKVINLSEYYGTKGKNKRRRNLI